jgi:hypothetical protein
MNKFWVLIRNSAGAPMKVNVFAENAYKAIEVARALYGKSLISEGANYDN